MTFDGFLWEPLGQATLEVTPAGLRVSNIGNSGEDGVRQVVPPGYVPGTPNPFHRVVRDGLQEPGAPVGAFLRWRRCGTLNGVPGQTIVTETATVTGTGTTSCQADFTPIAPTSLTANYSLDGVLVLTEPGLPVLCNGDDDWKTPDDYGTGWTWKFSVPGTRLRTFAGQTVMTDEVSLTPVGSNAVVGETSSIRWTASHVSTFTIEANN